jgi:hypothetical protein
MGQEDRKAELKEAATSISPLANKDFDMIPYEDNWSCAPRSQTPDTERHGPGSRQVLSTDLSFSR